MALLPFYCLMLTLGKSVFAGDPATLQEFNRAIHNQPITIADDATQYIDRLTYYQIRSTVTKLAAKAQEYEGVSDGAMYSGKMSQRSDAHRGQKYSFDTGYVTDVRLTSDNKFTCNTDGYYFFSLTLRSKTLTRNPYRTGYGIIVKENSPLTFVDITDAIFHHSGSMDMMGSAAIIAPCMKGEKVWVEHLYDNTYSYYRVDEAYFSAFLISI